MEIALAALEGEIIGFTSSGKVAYLSEALDRRQWNLGRNL
jgi:hypothetical protein